MKVIIEGSRARAVGPFDINTIKTISLLSGSKRWASSKSVTFDSTATNLKKLRELKGIEWDDKTGELDIIDQMDKFSRQDDKVKSAKSKWKPAHKLRKHQQKCIDVSWDRSSYGLLFEMGLGKTSTLIANAGMLYAAGKIKAAIIIAPKGVDRQWIESEIPKHADPAFKVQTILWANKPIDLRMMKKDHLVFFALNIEAILYKGGPAVESIIEHFGGDVLLIVDESHRIKNGSAKSSKAITKIGLTVKYRRIATGTPIAKNIEDAWSQFRFLDERILGHRYITSFRAEYCVMGGYQMKKAVASKNVEQFNRLISPHSFRITKGEALDLPPKIYIDAEYDMSPESRRVYTELKKQLMTELSDGTIITVTNAAAGLVRLQQVACGFLPQEGGGMDNLSNERIEVLLDIIDQVEGPVVIWARFKEDIRRIEEAIKGEGETCVTYYGDTKKPDRKKAVDDFLSGKKRIFISNQASGGTGLNLQGACRSVIYYSNDFSSLNRWQSEDRTHRIGIDGPVRYFDIIARKSIDGVLLKNLKGKTDMASFTLDGIRSALKEM